MAKSELESLMELIARQQSDLLQHIQVLVRRDVERYEHDVLLAGVAQPVPDWARSVYVDNTQGTAAVTLAFDAGLRFLVPAGAGVVLPCAKFRSVVASQQVSVLWSSSRAPLAQVGGPGGAVPADVQLTGSLAPLSFTGWKSVSVGYATIGTSYQWNLPGIFNRNARSRTILLTYTVNQPVSANVYPYDSSMGTTPSLPGNSFSISGLANGQQIWISAGIDGTVHALTDVTVSTNGGWSMNLDSIIFNLSATTAPTSGSITLLYGETL